MRRVALSALLALVVLAAGASAAVRQRTTMAVILPQVMCVTCHIPLNVAQSPQADAERNYIQTLIDEGDTARQVKRALVAQYGTEVLALPPASGFNLAVYIVPIVVVVVLAAVLSFVLPRWRRNRQGADLAVAGGPDPVTAEEAVRLDAELAAYDAPRRR